MDSHPRSVYFMVDWRKSPTALALWRAWNRQDNDIQFLGGRTYAVSRTIIADDPSILFLR